LWEEGNLLLAGLTDNYVRTGSRQEKRRPRGAKGNRLEGKGKLSLAETLQFLFALGK